MEKQDTNYGTRLSQIRKLHLERQQLPEYVKELNSSIINNVGEENIKSFIAKKISGMSLDEIENIKFRLLKYEGIELPRDTSLLNIFYSILTQKILLPDYIGNDNETIIHEELEKIIGRYNKKINSRISRLDDVFFNLSIGDETILYKTLKEWDIEDRIFNIGGVFGRILFGLPDKDSTYELQIPVKVSRKKGSTVEKLLDVEKIEDILDKYREDKRFAELDIDDGGMMRDKDEVYGNEPDATYYKIKITHDTFDIMSTDYGTYEEIREAIGKFIEIANCIINEIAAISPLDHGKRHFSFFSSHPYLFKGGNNSEIDSGVEQKFSKLILDKKKKVFLEDIGGQEKAKKEVEKIILGLKHKEIMDEWGGRMTSGILFYGPPGTGKTLMAMAIASEVDADVMNIRMTDIADSAFINDGAKNIKQLFEFIRFKAKSNPNRKMVVILDEMDALLKKRSGERQSDEDKKIVNTFLAEMGGFDDVKNVIFIGTTNNYQQLDEAVKRSGRFTTKIKVELPNEKGREQIFGIHIKKARKAAVRTEIFNENISPLRLAGITEGLSGADIDEVIRMTVEAKAIEQIRKLSTEETVELISEEEISASVEQLKASNGKANEIIKDYRIDALLKQINEKGKDYFRDSLYRIIADQAIAELKSALESGKIGTQQLIDVYESIGNLGKEAGFR